MAASNSASSMESLTLSGCDTEFELFSYLFDIRKVVLYPLDVESALLKKYRATCFNQSLSSSSERAWYINEWKNEIPGESENIGFIRLAIWVISQLEDMLLPDAYGDYHYQ